MLAGAVTLLLVASTLPAQGDITWGPELGLNLTTYGGSDASAAGAANKMGLHAGVALKHQKAGKKMFIQSGLAYSMRGSEFDIAGFTGTTKFNYIEIPAMAGWSFPSSNASSKITPHVVAGANLGIKAGCTQEAGGSSADCTDVAGMDVGIGGGGGVTLASGNGDWQFTVLYLLGMINVDDPPSGTAADMKNRGLTVKAAWFMKKKAP